MAAAVAVAALVWPRMGARTGPGTAGSGTKSTTLAQSGQDRGTGGDPRDVNGDGVVDILDAFAVARAVEGSDEERRVRAGGRVPMRWDFNGDGVVVLESGVQIGATRNYIRVLQEKFEAG